MAQGRQTLQAPVVAIITSKCPQQSSAPKLGQKLSPKIAVASIQDASSFRPVRLRMEFCMKDQKLK